MTRGKGRCDEPRVATLLATTALGAGLDWNFVRMVFRLGAAEPTQVMQEFGRGGRDGEKSLCWLFVEDASSSLVVKEKLKMNEWKAGGERQGQEMTPDEAMVVFAHTPVCLWVAMTLYIR